MTLKNRVFMTAAAITTITEKVMPKEAGGCHLEPTLESDRL